MSTEELGRLRVEIESALESCQQVADESGGSDTVVESPIQPNSEERLPRGRVRLEEEISCRYASSAQLPRHHVDLEGENNLSYRYAFAESA